MPIILENHRLAEKIKLAVKSQDSSWRQARNEIT